MNQFFLQVLIIVFCPQRNRNPNVLSLLCKVADTELVKPRVRVFFVEHQKSILLIELFAKPWIRSFCKEEVVLIPQSSQGEGHSGKEVRDQPPGIAYVVSCFSHLYITNTHNSELQRHKNQVSKVTVIIQEHSTPRCHVYNMGLPHSNIN